MRNERAARVGGQIWMGAASSMRGPWARIAEFYERQAHKSTLNVRLGVEADAQNIIAMQPDAVVVASGSLPLRAEVPGGHDALTVHEAINGGAPAPQYVVILDQEGFMRPFVVADALSSRGVRVEFVSPLASIGPLMEHWSLDE